MKSIIYYIKKKFNITKNNNVGFLVLVIYIIISIFGIISLANKNLYKNFIPDFNNLKYSQKNMNFKDKYKGNNVKFKNRTKKIKQHNDGVNIFSTMSIMILFAGGTYYIFNIMDKRAKS